VALLERLLPYRRAWNRPQGDLAADAAYLPTTWAIRGLLDPLLVALSVAAGGWLSRSLGTGLWPAHWPLLGQLALACAVAELFDYWAHRAMHESEWLWRLHATHHSAPRLYWLNATRAHPGEIALRGAVSALPLAVLGAGEPVLALIAVTSIAVGLFQHANVDFALGPLSWVFSVGELHRWHHARDRALANTNYGNNFIFWDAVFGTRYRPSDREPPDAIGIAGLEAFPRGWLAQLLSPLRWSRIQALSAAPGAGASRP
jgi:sterol desaturase/sphingolipid hydroxylase (fatty acid hydroxylase superfamily)